MMLSDVCRIHRA